MCIGDGCLRKPHPKTGCVQLEIAHSNKQKEYCEHKKSLIENILHKNIKLHERKVLCSLNNKSYDTCRFMITNDYFIYLRKLLYPFGRKTMNRNILNKLTLEGIAIWYMDDGSCYYKISDISNKPIQIDLRISTDCFTKEENEDIIKYFKEVWGINFHLFYQKSRNCWIIRARKQAALKFIDLIKPYVHPSMMYKCLFKQHERETSNDEDIV